MTATLEHRAKALGRLVDEVRDMLDNAYILTDSAYGDEASDLLTLAKDTMDWAEELGPDAEAWALGVVNQTGYAMRLLDSVRLSLDLTLAQLYTLTNEINKNPA